MQQTSLRSNYIKRIEETAIARRFSLPSRHLFSHQRNLVQRKRERESKRKKRNETAVSESDSPPICGNSGSAKKRGLRVNMMNDRALVPNIIPRSAGRYMSPGALNRKIAVRVYICACRYLSRRWTSIRSLREFVADKSPEFYSARIKSVNKAASGKERSHKVCKKHSI